MTDLADVVDLGAGQVTGTPRGYLNTAAEGLPLVGADQAMERYLTIKDRGSQGRGELDAIRDQTAALVGATIGVDAADVAFVASTSRGLDIALQSVDWQPGDNIVFGDTEFPTIAFASTLLAQVEKVYRAGLGNEAVARIALSNTLSRADVVALIYRHMKLTKLLPSEVERKRRADETGESGSNDYAGHPLADAIVDLHRRNLRGLYIVDGQFRPKDPISREEFALLLEDLIVSKSGNKRLARSFIGSPSPFGDLDPARVSFNAFMTATSRGLLHPDSEGNIQPTTPISGADAILALRTLSGTELIPAN